MPNLSMTVSPHYKKVIIKQQAVTTSSVIMTQLAVSDIITAGLNSQANSVPMPDNIYIQAAPGNSGTVTVMPVNPAVSLGAGYILSAGVGVNLPTRTASEWYVIGSAAGVLNIHYQFGAT